MDNNREEALYIEEKHTAYNNSFTFLLLQNFFALFGKPTSNHRLPRLSLLPLYLLE